MKRVAPLHDDGVLLGDGVLAVVGVVTMGHLVSLLGVQPGRTYGSARFRPLLELPHLGQPFASCPKVEAEESSLLLLLPFFLSTP